MKKKLVNLGKSKALVLDKTMLGLLGLDDIHLKLIQHEDSYSKIDACVNIAMGNDKSLIITAVDLEKEITEYNNSIYQGKSSVIKCFDEREVETFLTCGVNTEYVLQREEDDLKAREKEEKLIELIKGEEG